MRTVRLALALLIATTATADAGRRVASRPTIARKAKKPAVPIVQ